MSIRKMIREISSKAAGWIPDITKKGHIKWTHASGAVVVSATTPSCHRAIVNTIALMRRKLRQKGQKAT